jgi:transposase
MTWKPARLTREQMEERRLEGGRLLKAGKLSQAEIARRLGVSRTAVNQWAKQMTLGGLRQLRRRRGGGRPAKLTREQQRQLRRLLKRGAPAAGFPTARWTLPRVQQVIQWEFGVVYHVKYLNRLLQQLGWSLQQPVACARERDEALIRAWLAHDWPRIKKSAAARCGHRVLR